MVLVHGEAGVGKSRLVREATAVARQAGVSVFSGRAVQSGEAYRPLAEALSAALRGRPLPRENGLRPYLPALSALLPDAGIAGRSDPRGGVILGEAILRLVSTLASPRGAMLVLEDLHWADPDTLDVLSYLADAASTSPVVLVATARDELDPPQRLLDLARACQAAVIPLDRLGPQDVRGVVESCLSGPPPEELVRFVIEHADGLPLLVEELLTGLVAVGALAPDGTLTGPLATNVPRTFAATVRSRLAGLKPSARSVVETAAVLGRRFDWRLIPEITGLGEQVVLAGLRSAVATGLVVVDATETDTFRFRHALTCEAVRTDLLPPEHRALARAAAAVVEQREPEAYDLAAGLWMAAGEDSRAAELYLYAGRQARRRGALHTADAQLTRAATLAADKPDLRREAEAALIGVLADAGDNDRALALGERLLDRGDTWVQLTLAEVAAEAGRWDVAAAGLTALPDTDDPRAKVLAARLAHERGQPDDAQSIAELALIEAEERNQWSVACQALEVMGRAARVTDLKAARDAFLAAERLAIDHDLPLERVSALHELGTVDLLLDGSTVQLERARALALDAGALGLAAKVDEQMAASLLHRDADAALVHAERSAERARRLRMDQLRATALFFQAAAHAHHRNSQAMERCVADARRLAPDDLDVNAGIWGAVYAHVALLDDDRDRLAECLDRAIEFLRRQPHHRAGAHLRVVGAGAHPGRPGGGAGPSRSSPVRGELGEPGAARLRRRGRRRPPWSASRSRAAARRGRCRDELPALVAAPDPAAGRRRRARQQLGRPHRLDPGGAGGIRPARRRPAGHPLPGGAAPGRRPGATARPWRHRGASAAPRLRGDQPGDGRPAVGRAGADQRGDRRAAGALTAHRRDTCCEPGRQNESRRTQRLGPAG